MDYLLLGGYVMLYFTGSDGGSRDTNDVLPYYYYY